MLEIPSPALRPEAASSAMPGTARLSHMPLDREIPLVLTSHFGRFHAKVADGGHARRIKSRIAFSHRESGAGEAEALVSAHDFWACRTTHAIDILTGRAHRLIWGLDAKGALVTFIRPLLDLSAPAGRGVPRLIPIDQRSFHRIGESAAQEKPAKRKRRPASST